MTSEKKETITGYILAGGKSLRMRKDKGLMLLHNKPLILHIIEKLKHAVVEIVIVSHNTDYKKFGFEVIPDLIKDIGPAGGIHAALGHSKVNSNFILSCDMPFINPVAIDFIIKHSASAQITVPVKQHQTEPLFGVYSSVCLHRWDELIQQGNIKLQDMISNFKLNTICVDAHAAFDELTFSNINSPLDLDNAIHSNRKQEFNP